MKEDQEKKLFRSMLLIFLGIAIGCVLCSLIGFGKAEAYTEQTTVRVNIRLLNGRAKPSRKSPVEARFDYGDLLTAYGWSPKHNWIEVDGGESGTVWVWWEYVNEQKEECTTWINDELRRVKIRKKPFGTVIGYLKSGKEVEIDQILLGWGHCSKGWIDLSYLTKED